MKKTEEKTNALRLLDAQGIAHTVHTYDPHAADGGQVAQLLGQSPDQVFKTLVTVAPSRKNYVFVVPVNCTLHLKKAAAAVGEKAVEMIKSKELLPLTGYVHGGCSPIGMKKPFRTLIHRTAEQYETILFSAGKIGFQVECSLDGLRQAVPVESADLTV